MKTTFLALALGLLVAPAFAAEPPAAAAAASVRVEGEVAHPGVLDAAQLATLPRLTVTGDDHGQKATFEGVSLSAVLAWAQAPLGQHLRGPNMGLYVLVRAADNYQAVFALPELDPEYNDRVVLLADRRDGKPLDAHEGPFRIVVDGEKRQGRWVRQVISIHVLRAPAP